MCNINFVVFFLPAKVVNYILKVCLGLVLGLHLFVIIKICVRYLFVSRNEEITIL